MASVTAKGLRDDSIELKEQPLKCISLFTYPMKKYLNAAEVWPKSCPSEVRILISYLLTAAFILFDDRI